MIRHNYKYLSAPTTKITVTGKNYSLDKMTQKSQQDIKRIMFNACRNHIIRVGYANLQHQYKYITDKYLKDNPYSDLKPHYYKLYYKSNKRAAVLSNKAHDQANRRLAATFITDYATIGSHLPHSNQSSSHFTITHICT